MRYERVSRARFLSRPNRFTAMVETVSGSEMVHVRNTGRCRELLTVGAEVYLTEVPVRPGQVRKTRYDLIAVRNRAGLTVNMDSQAPNHVVREWLEKQGADEIRGEYTYGQSRLDFYVRKGERRILMEVKGCTLEVDGIGYFPDAPTQRGVRHLHELMDAVREGLEACLVFVMQVPGMREVRGNRKTHPAFDDALTEAREKGVRVICLPCRVEPDILEVSAEGEAIEL